MAGRWPPPFWTLELYPGREKMGVVAGPWGRLEVAERVRDMCGLFSRHWMVSLVLHPSFLTSWSLSPSWRIFPAPSEHFQDTAHEDDVGGGQLRSHLVNGGAELAKHLVSDQIHIDASGLGLPCHFLVCAKKRKKSLCDGCDVMMSVDRRRLGCPSASGCRAGRPAFRIERGAAHRMEGLGRRRGRVG